jgi:hypothetical protein
MRAYNITYSDFKRRLAGDGNAIAVGGDLVALVLGGLIATTGNATTKAALGAAATGVLGAQGVINKDLYFQRTLPALLAQMDANRTQAEAIIVSRLRLSDTEYPLQVALLDLDALRDTGSLPSAIGGITQSAVQAKIDAQSKTEFHRDAAFIATRPERELIKARIDKLNSDQLLQLSRLMGPNLNSRSATLQANLSRLGVEQTRLTRPNDALLFLEAWIGNEDPSPATNLTQWQDALNQIERSPSPPRTGARSGPSASGTTIPPPDRLAIKDRIDQLKPPQLLALAKTMQPLLSTRPKEVRDNLSNLHLAELSVTDPDKAKEYLEAWVSFERSPTFNAKQWADAIKQAASK